MAESRWLSRMPVYDIVKGRVVGRIHRLIVDPDARKVVGLLLATRLGREPRCLPFRHVHAIGDHAVTVRGTEAIVPISELPDMEEAMRAQRRIYNSPILTEGGAFIGDVDEFTINTQSGRLEALLVSGGLIRDMLRGQAALPSHLIVAVGEDATIVKDIAVTFLAQRQSEQRQKEGTARLADVSATSSGARHGHARRQTLSSPNSTGFEERGANLPWTERLRQAFTFRRRIGDTFTVGQRETSADAGDEPRAANVSSPALTKRHDVAAATRDAPAPTTSTGGSGTATARSLDVPISQTSPHSEAADTRTPAARQPLHVVERSAAAVGDSEAVKTESVHPRDQDSARMESMDTDGHREPGAD